MLSQHYLSMKNSYEGIKNQVSSLSSYIDTCTSTIDRCKVLLDETIIDNEPIDKGLLSNITASLNDLRTTIAIVIKECDVNISKYNSLYYAALETERLQKEAEKQI